MFKTALSLALGAPWGTDALQLYHPSCITEKRSRLPLTRAAGRLCANTYDSFISDGVPDVTFLNEENIVEALGEFIESDYGHSMFGKHPMPARCVLPHCVRQWPGCR